MNKTRQSRKNADDSIEGRLPLTVTRISAQKKNADRVSLFHEDLFLVGISRTTLQEYSIREGVTLTPSLYRDLRSSEGLQAVKDACFRYLARRDHSAFELKQKVGRKGFPESDINRVIEDLAASGYIDDEKFALKFVSDKIELNQWGPRKIRSALFKKGINRKIIDKVLDQETDDLQLRQICVDLVLKRKRHFLREEDPYKRKQKIYQYLAGRGFSGSVIKSSLSQISAKLDA